MYIIHKADASHHKKANKERNIRDNIIPLHHHHHSPRNHAKAKDDSATTKHYRAVARPLIRLVNNVKLIRNAEVNQLCRQQQHKNNYISQSRAHLFEQPNAYNHKITVNPKTKPRNTILNNVSNKMKEKESNKPTIYESINKKENLFIEKVKKNSNDKNLKNNEKRKSSFENPQVQNDNYGINITPLRVKTSSDINFSPYTNQIKSKKLFVDKMQTNNNYNTTKSTHKIVVMKIIRNNSKKPYLSSTFNDSKFSSTYNSIKDNKNPSENEQKYHKINLKLNSNDKSKRYFYNRLKKIYKNSLDNNIYNNKML